MNAAGAGMVAPDLLPGLLGHELRNPLASALTGVMLARDLLDDGDPRAGALDGVLRDLDRMTALIDGWLALARGSAPERRRIAVDGLLADVARRHRAELLACPSDVATVGNRVLLERVFDNLCDNARRAGAASIRIAAQLDGDDGIAIHVEDDGSGVAPEHAQRIFVPGWSRTGGNGLGLHAVATTLAMHGGAVRCVPLAHGTRFTLTLRRAAAELP